MAQPAGAQIRRWFVLLVGLLIFVDLAALAGSVLVSQSVRAVVERAAPLATSSAAVRHEVLAAQRDLFRYIAEFLDDTKPALLHLDELNLRLEEARRLGVSPGVEEDLEAIRQSSQKYRKVLELMPRTVEGSRDWARLQEYSATAVQLGNAMEEGALRLVSLAEAEIADRSRRSERVTDAAKWGAAGVFAASLLIIVALCRWWRNFQDVILEL